MRFAVEEDWWRRMVMRCGRIRVKLIHNLMYVALFLILPETPTNMVAEHLSFAISPVNIEEKRQANC